MFQLIVALAFYLAMSPIRPALSLTDLEPPKAYPDQHLSVSATRAAELPTSEPEVAPVRKNEGRLGIETNAKAVAVLDWNSQQLLFEKNADEPMPIASITKLMTALVVLDTEPNWESVVEFILEDERIGDLPVLRPGDQVTVRDLFNLSLVSSSNDGSMALARSTGMSHDEFVRHMNLKAADIGMEGYYFVEPTGLDSRNSATAIDVARLIRAALNQEEIAETVLMRLYDFETIDDGASHRVWSTDRLLDSFLTKPPYSFLGGKTGYLREAGYCFGAAASNENGNKVIAVVLGANSKDQRFQEVKRLIWWAFDAWTWDKTGQE